MFRAALQGTRHGLAGGVLLVVLLSWLFRDAIGGLAYQAWLASFALAVVARIATLAWFDRLRDEELGAPHAAVTTALFVVIGVLWGLAGFVFPIGATVWAPFAILTAQTFMVLMAIPGLSWYWPCFAAFATPVILLAPWPWLGVNPEIARVVAVGGVFILLTVGAFAARHARLQIDTLRLRDERAELLRELQARGDRLARNLAAKARFLAVASHDLRQPLHAMSLLLKNADAGAPFGAADRQTLAAMVRSTDDMLLSLVDAARGDDPEGSWTPQDCDVQSVLDGVLEEQAGHAADHGLLLRVRHGRWTVRSHPLALQRIARNLLSNAIRYTRHGGVLAALRLRKGQIWLEVWDTGPGIAPQEQEAIFSAYQRGENAATGGPGLGLGLSVVRQLCGTLGHALEMRSRPGRGTVFRVGLGAPIAQRGAGAADSAPQAMLCIADGKLAMHAGELFDLWGVTWRRLPDPRTWKEQVTGDRSALPVIEGPALPRGDAPALQGRAAIWLGAQPGEAEGAAAARLPLPLEPVALHAAFNRLRALAQQADDAARSPANAS